MPIPSTSTTLLRQMAADSRHVRWGEFVRCYQPMMEEYLRTHFPGLESEDIIGDASLENGKPIGVGTPGYAAPEQFIWGGISPAAAVRTTRFAVADLRRSRS